MTTSRTLTLGSAVTAAALLALTGCANEPTYNDTDLHDHI